MREPDALCRLAGRSPDEEITRFVLEDYVVALMQAGESEEEVVEKLKTARVSSIANCFLEGSDWMTVLGMC